MGTRKSLYKAVRAVPSAILDLNGVPLDYEQELQRLVNDTVEISSIADYITRNEDLINRIDDYAHINQANTVGRLLGVRIPDAFKQPGATGESRREALVQHNVITAVRSWNERIKAYTEKSSKHVSAGWKRTAFPSAPGYSSGHINLGAVNAQYARFVSNPLESGNFAIDIVVDRQWRRFVFDVNMSRFADANRVANPTINIKNGRPVFTFPVEYEDIKAEFSSRHIVGVDVGINNFATVVVIDRTTGEIVMRTALSQRVRSMSNSIKATKRQVESLARIEHDYHVPREKRVHAAAERVLQREALSRKKRELAIVAAQEVANIAYEYDNAVVAVEDLSWVKNTMANGRWNRGEFVKWLDHYLSFNGGWSVRVNSAHTSTTCHRCDDGARGGSDGWRVFVCLLHGRMDRDENAAANIALRARGVVDKARVTQGKNRKLVKRAPKRSPRTHESLSYSCRSRDKSAPTPRRPKKSVRSRVLVGEVCRVFGPVSSDVATVDTDAVFPRDLRAAVAVSAYLTAMSSFM